TGESCLRQSASPNPAWNKGTPTDRLRIRHAPCPPDHTPVPTGTKKARSSPPTHFFPLILPSRPCYPSRRLLAETEAFSTVTERPQAERRGVQGSPRRDLPTGGSVHGWQEAYEGSGGR